MSNVINNANDSTICKSATVDVLVNGQFGLRVTRTEDDPGKGNPVRKALRAISDMMRTEEYDEKTGKVSEVIETPYEIQAITAR